MTGLLDDILPSHFDADHECDGRSKKKQTDIIAIGAGAIELAGARTPILNFLQRARWTRHKLTGVASKNFRPFATEISLVTTKNKQQS